METLKRMTNSDTSYYMAGSCFYDEPCEGDHEKAEPKQLLVVNC